MNGQMDGWMDGWMYRWISVWFDATLTPRIKDVKNAFYERNLKKTLKDVE